MKHPDTTRLQQAVWRLEDLLKNDDGQAWKEASKFLERLKKEQREEAKPAAPVVWPEPVGQVTTSPHGLFFAYDNVITATPKALYTRAQVETMLKAQRNG